MNVPTRFVTAALVVLLTAAVGLVAQVPQSPAADAATGYTVLSHPLGVNVAPWDEPANNSRIETYLKALGPVSLRYGSGVWSDAYDWQSNKDTYSCSLKGHQTGNFTGPCASSSSDYTNYNALNSEARTLSAQGMVTVNYGTGTPALAGAWAAKVAADHDPVTQFEIGNEGYGCGSPDIPVTLAPEYYKSYEPGVNADCPQTTQGSLPGMMTLAKSFIAHAPQYIADIKKADPKAQIILPYAISPPGNSGYVWNDAVMPALKGKYSGINVLWYPTRATNSPTASADLLALRDIPARAAAIRSDVSKYASGKYWMIGEENVDNQPTSAPCSPVGAVFAAGSALAWLAQGASNVNWWLQEDGNNANGKCDKNTYSMFDLAGSPQTPYWGYLLASKLAQRGAVLSVDRRNSNPDVLAFHSALPGGDQAEAYINLSTSISERASAPSVPSGGLTVWQYSAGKQNASHSEITIGSTTTSAVGTSVNLPAESVTVYETGTQSPTAAPAHPAAQVSGQHVTITWGKVPAGTGYQVQVTLPGGDTWQDSKMSASRAVYGNATKSGTYVYRLRAYNSKGDGPWTSSLKFTVANTRLLKGRS